MEDAAFEIDRKDLIEGLGKGLRVIEAFDDDHTRLTPGDAAVRAGMTRTAARRYLLSLVHYGYADTDGKQFWLTPRVLRLGQSYLGAARLPRLVQPFIQRISAQCGETVNASVLDGHEMVYVARSNAPRLISIGFHVGARAPAHVVTPGIVSLSTLSDEALDRWIVEHEFTSYNPHTITDKGRFKANVQAARERDYWITEQQLEMALRGIATVLRDRKGHYKGAIGLTIPSQTYTSEQMTDKLLPLLREAAQALRPLL